MAGFFETLSPLIAADDYIGTLRDRFEIRARPLAQITPDEMATIGEMLEDETMRFFAEQNYQHAVRTVVFFLYHDGKIIGSRCLGHAYWEEECWGGHIRQLGMAESICDSSYAVAPAYRGVGLGTELWQFTTDWAVARASLPIIWGDVEAAAAFELYVKRGAFIYQPDLAALKEHLNIDVLDDIFRACRKARLLPNKHVVRYLWLLDEKYRARLEAIGYRKMA